MKYRNIEDLNLAILRRLYILPRDLDLIVGIPRSGMIPATLIALYLNLEVTDLGSFINGHIYSIGDCSGFPEERRYKKILIVDDSIASGQSFERCNRSLNAIRQQYEILTAAVYVAPGKELMVDYVFETLPLPRVFQWNIFRHSILQRTCMDIDGVLCVDPTKAQNDDGVLYEEFIQHAVPLYIPKIPIGALVTSRLEKYRPQTERWLKDHGIIYGKLIMSEDSSSDRRKINNDHAVIKAKEYRSMKYNLFIESSLEQAIEINILTGKPVLCVENFQMIYNSQSLVYKIRRGERVPFLHRIGLHLKRKIQGIVKI